MTDYQEPSNRIPPVPARVVGGGLIRSLGGWEAVKKMKIDGQERIKGDQRILGDSGLGDALDFLDIFRCLICQGEQRGSDSI